DVMDLFTDRLRQSHGFRVRADQIVRVGARVVKAPVHGRTGYAVQTFFPRVSHNSANLTGIFWPEESVSEDVKMAADDIGAGEIRGRKTTIDNNIDRIGLKTYGAWRLGAREELGLTAQFAGDQRNLCRGEVVRRNETVLRCDLVFAIALALCELQIG